MSQDRQTYDELRKYSQEISRLLKDNGLTPEERHEFENLQDRLAGSLCSPWVPFGLLRRTIMVAVFLVGLYGLMEGPQYLIFGWLLLPLFSPRIVGESVMAIGRVFGLLFRGSR